MKRSVIKILLIALGMLALSGSVQAKGDMVNIGGLEFSADSALVKDERPRLLFRGRDLPKYKARVQGVMKNDYKRFKAFWDKTISKKDYDWKSVERMDGICLGVLYQLSGERRYADVIKKSSVFNKGGLYWSYAFTLDLIMDTLSNGEIKTQIDRFLSYGVQKKFRWGQSTFCLWPAIAFYGADPSRDEEIAKWLVRGVNETRNDIQNLNYWAGNRGGDFNSFSYIGNHTLIRLGAHVTAMSNALDEDVWEVSTWMRHLDSYYIYHFMPWRNSTIHFDNTTGLQFGPRNAFGGDYLLHAAPAHYRDGLYQWWIHNFLVAEDPKAKGWPREGREIQVMSGFWGKLLFYDPEIPERQPEDLPPSRFFPTRGIASMRENWSKDATFVHFRAGALGGLGDHRHNADNNTFTIYKKGILALDTGGTHRLDTNRLKFGLLKGNPHHIAYSPKTLAHNAILVKHEKDKPIAIGGGSLLNNWPAYWSKMRGEKITEKNVANIIAYETSPEFDHVCGDATNNYDPRDVDLFTREMVYVRPNLIFVYDRIDTARDLCHSTFLLHTADKPEINGEEVPDKSIHPDGHYLWQGNVITVTDEEMGGRMFVKMLLPEEREIRLLGGEYHEFETPDGTNHGPTAETYKMPLDSGGIRSSRSLGEGLRGWRIEVEEKDGSRTQRFLNVFQTCDKDVAIMIPCELVSRNDMEGAKVEVDGRTVEVLFNREKSVGGEITIDKDGENVIQRTLSDKIEDHYERWKDHPDYEKWMNDPFLRSVVLGETPDHKQSSEYLVQTAVDIPSKISLKDTIHDDRKTARTILFKEDFEDTGFTSRGWYDNTNLHLSISEHISESMSSAEFHFSQSDKTPLSGNAIRRKFTETDEVYVSYFVKYSANWEGSNKPFHPHEFYLLTNVDEDWTGPSSTHLTAYIEQNEGVSLLSIQDAQNIDESNIGVDLTHVTEKRAVAGCNGDGDCYQAGAAHNNGKQWKADNICFQDEPGKYYKNDWHFVEAYFKLNSISGGKGVADGQLKYWYDGNLIIDHNDVIMRTAQHPDMKFNQFLIGPFIGVGSPVDQTFWIDNLTVATSRAQGSIPSGFTIGLTEEEGLQTAVNTPTQEPELVWLPQGIDLNKHSMGPFTVKVRVDGIDEQEYSSIIPRIKYYIGTGNSYGYFDMIREGDNVWRFDILDPNWYRCRSKSLRYHVKVFDGEDNVITESNWQKELIDSFVQDYN